jgi:hypothetical protein
MAIATVVHIIILDIDNRRGEVHCNSSHIFKMSLSFATGLESRKYGHRNPSLWPRGTLCPQKLALTSPSSSGHSVGIVHLWAQATELFLCHLLSCIPLKPQHPLLQIQSYSCKVNRTYITHYHSAWSQRLFFLVFHEMCSIWKDVLNKSCRP